MKNKIGCNERTLLEKQVKHWEDKATECLKLYQEQGDKFLNAESKAVTALGAEIDRLNRIMPHIGETCKHFDMNTNECQAQDTASPQWECGMEWHCHNGKWKLKD